MEMDPSGQGWKHGLSDPVPTSRYHLPDFAGPIAMANARSGKGNGTDDRGDTDGQPCSHTVMLPIQPCRALRLRERM